MSDFYNYVNEKKALVSSARKRKCGSKSKRCSLPSDKLTDKQWKERCGEIMTYNMEKPMNWGEFKSIPSDIQKQYILHIIEKYGATASDIGKLFGVHSSTVTNFCKGEEISIKFSPGKKMPKEKREPFGRLCGMSSEVSEDACTADVKNITAEEISVGSADKECEEIVVERKNDHVEDKEENSMKMSKFSIRFVGKVKVDGIANSLKSMLGDDSIGVVTVTYESVKDSYCDGIA